MFAKLNKATTILQLRSLTRLNSISSQLSSGNLRQLTTTATKTKTNGKMKEAIVRKGTKVEIVDSPIPKAGKDQVVIKVEYSGSNPKDW